jgi:ATP-dependent DNA helicase RecG
MQAHLASIGSELYEQSLTMPLAELARKINVAAGPDEYLKPKNIGLLLFNNDPHAFFPCARIDLVEFKDAVGDRFTEKYFSGPIQRQLEDALLYIKNSVIVERVRKVSGQAKAQRYYNYPYDAIEEALANTVYHRSYEDDSPIELRIFPDKIEMISFPGPLPPLNKAKLLSGKIVARKYRNRRIGDFLKELHLTEGRGTGIPKIIRAMERNGSPAPTFDTDDELSYFLVTLPTHHEWTSISANAQDDAQDFVSVQARILRHCLRPRKRREVMTALGLSNHFVHYLNYMKPLIDAGYLVLTVPDKPNSKNQQYRTTSDGEQHLMSLDNQTDAPN